MPPELLRTAKEFHRLTELWRDARGPMAYALQQQREAIALQAATIAEECGYAIGEDRWNAAIDFMEAAWKSCS